MIADLEQIGTFLSGSQFVHHFILLWVRRQFVDTGLRRIPPKFDVYLRVIRFVEGGIGVWNDRGSGADDDVTIWQANPNGYGQGVIAMSSVRCHCNMNRNPTVLDPKYVNYVVGKPAKRYILTNVQYLLDDRDLLNQAPEVLATTTVINRGSIEQETTRAISYTYEESFSWSDSIGLEVGVSTEITAGVPLIGEATVSQLVHSNCMFMLTIYVPLADYNICHNLLQPRMGWQ